MKKNVPYRLISFLFLFLLSFCIVQTPAVYADSTTGNWNIATTVGQVHRDMGRYQDQDGTRQQLEVQRRGHIGESKYYWEARGAVGQTTWDETVSTDGDEHYTVRDGQLEETTRVALTHHGNDYMIGSSVGRVWVFNEGIFYLGGGVAYYNTREKSNDIAFYHEDSDQLWGLVPTQREQGLFMPVNMRYNTTRGFDEWNWGVNLMMAPLLKGEREHKSGDVEYYGYRSDDGSDTIHVELTTHNDATSVRAGGFQGSLEFNLAPPLFSADSNLFVLPYLRLNYEKMYRGDKHDLEVTETHDSENSGSTTYNYTSDHRAKKYESYGVHFGINVLF